MLIMFVFFFSESKVWLVLGQHYYEFWYIVFVYRDYITYLYKDVFWFENYPKSNENK